MVCIDEYKTSTIIMVIAIQYAADLKNRPRHCFPYNNKHTKVKYYVWKIP